MRRTTLLILIALLYAFRSFAQSDSNLLPFIVEGRITNFADKNLILLLPAGKEDTIKVDETGKFYFETFEVTKPIEVVLSKTAAFFRTNLFIAPGYHLIINADTKTWNSFQMSKKVIGYGSIPNRYLFTLDSINTTRSDTTQWPRLDKDPLLIYANKHLKLEDSVLNVIFNKTSTNDLYSDIFKRKILLDMQFERFEYLITPGLDSKYDYQTSVDFVNNNLDKKILNNLYSEEYLLSDTYRRFMLNDYFQYLADLVCKNANCDNKYYRIRNLEAIANNYQGPVKQLALNSELTSALTYCRSYEELNIYRDAMPKYLALLTKQEDIDNINKLFAKRESRFIKVQIGKSAPMFTAIDSKGKTFSLYDFKGKVVLIDLWASWCAPCRYQTPFLKKIEEKYKTDDRISFISIAVNDEEKKWRAAMVQDKATGIQLFDKNNTVVKGYYAYSIPKFVLISKDGKVVSFDSPMPSHADELEKLLDAEIAKQ